MVGRSQPCASPPAIARTPTVSRCPAAPPEAGRGMWGKRGMIPPLAGTARVFFRRMEGKRRCDGVLGYEHIARRHGKLRLPGRSVSLWARDSRRKDIRPGRDRARHSPHSPLSPEWVPRSGSIGECGESGEWFGRQRRERQCVFSPGCRSAGAAMEHSAMSAAGISGVPRPLGGAISAPRQRALAEKKFTPARTDQNIPHFPHIPRNGHRSGGDRGNGGKTGMSRPPVVAATVFSPDAEQEVRRWGARL